MRKILGLSAIAIGVGAVLGFLFHKEPLTTPSTVVQALPEQNLHYQTHQLKSSVVHTLLIPANSRFSVRIAVSQKLIPLERFVQKHQALAAINGGFFDPQNQKTTSYIIQQGQLVADPRLNERLINNPDNAPYLEKILNRTEFRQYRCGSSIRYDIALHSKPTPLGCELVDALGGGSRLLPELTLQEEGFLDVRNGAVTRDALGSNVPNARSAIGITHDGSILLVMVAQKPDAPTTTGMSLQSLADFMNTFGVQEAMNLDGGSSSSLYYQGKTFYGRVNAQGNRVQRSIKSVLLVF